MFCEKEKKKVKNHLVFVLVSVIQSEAKNLGNIMWVFTRSFASLWMTLNVEGFFQSLPIFIELRHGVEKQVGTCI